MLIPFILEENSDLLNDNVEMDEYLFKNYLEGLSFDAKGQIVLNEESTGYIEKKAKEFIEKEGERLRKAKENVKEDFDIAYWTGVAGVGIYILGIVLGSFTMNLLPMIIAIISLIASIFTQMFKFKSIQVNAGKLRNYRDKIARMAKDVKNQKIKEKLMDLKEEIDDGLNYIGDTVVMKESEDLNIIEDYDEFKLFNEFLEEF